MASIGFANIFEELEQSERFDSMGRDTALSLMIILELKKLNITMTAFREHGLNCKVQR